MSVINLQLTASELRRLYFRLSQCQVVGGRLAQIVAFMKRMLKVWPELAPGEDAAIAAAIPEDARRPLPFTAEEQSAVADALLRLLNSEKISNAQGEQIDSNVGIKLAILQDADLLGSPIARNIASRLARDPVEAFVESIDSDPDAITKVV